MRKNSVPVKKEHFLSITTNLNHASKNETNDSTVSQRAQGKEWHGFCSRIGWSIEVTKKAISSCRIQGK